MSTFNLVSGQLTSISKKSETRNYTDTDGHVEGRTIVYYDIRLGGQRYTVSKGYGKRMQVGQSYTMVMRGDVIILLRNKEGNVYGASNPIWLILVIIALSAFNYFFLPVFMKNNDSSNWGILLGVNVFLLLMTYFQIRDQITSIRAKNFLKNGNFRK